MTHPMSEPWLDDNTKKAIWASCKRIAELTAVMAESPKHQVHLELATIVHLTGCDPDKQGSP